MANTFIEPRPKGRKEGEPIEDYVVETASNSALHTAKTQEAAIEWEWTFAPCRKSSSLE